MNIKKIRGHRRKWKSIERWIEINKHLDLSYLKDSQKDYVKIRVHPWSGFSITNSQIPEPKSLTKYKILKGLLEIYDSWKISLDQLGEPYYLKIWLFEPYFSQSQVVCSIRDCLDFYENTFFKPDYSMELNIYKYGKLKDKISKFKWDYRLDEHHIDNNEPGDPGSYLSLEEYFKYKKRIERMMKKPHRKTKYPKPIDNETTEFYSFKVGNIWLGEK